MKKNNILILAITMKKGGAERVISLILKELQGQYKSLHLVTLESGIDYEIPASIKYTVLSNSQKSGIQKFIELPVVGWKIYQYIKENNINIVMSFLYRANYVNILAKLFGSNHRSIINIRSTTSRYLNEGVLGKVNLFLIRNLFNKSDMIISNSQGVDEDLKSLMRVTTETKVIYNPVDLELINKQKVNYEDSLFKFEDDIKYIISVGRLIPLKRQKDLIEAFYTLQKSDTKLELLFLGEGILREMLKEYSVSLGIEQKVHFLGNVQNPFVYMQQSNLFVLSSEIEGFPNVLTEAMAVGIPVISSDCKSGPREILENEKYGLLYPVGNIKVLIEKMKVYLYGNIDETKIEEHSFQQLENFKIKKIISQFESVL